MTRGIGVTEFLREILPEWATTVFVALSLPGDLIVIVPALGMLYAVDVTQRAHRKDAQRSPVCSDTTASIVAIILGGLALIVLLETVFALGRPPADWHAIETSPYGFPSGHTMAATICWGALAWVSSWGDRSVRLFLAGAIVAGVGISRLALGVHYVVDVLASFGLGVLYLGLAIPALYGRPVRGFAVAILLGMFAFGVTLGGTRGLLALSGTLGAALGWGLIEWIGRE